MNFTNSSKDLRADNKTPELKTADTHDDNLKGVDHTAMQTARKAQKRMHQNENTNSSNTMFTK